MDPDVLTEIRVTLGEIKADLKNALNRGDDHEARIRKLERIVWVAAGIAAASGGAVGAAATSILQGVGAN